MHAFQLHAEFAQARAKALQAEARERALTGVARNQENVLQALLSVLRLQRQPRLEVKRT